MTRRRMESAKLNDEAAARRRLAQMELEAADKLDAQATNLAGRAGSLQFQAQVNQAQADGLRNTFALSPLVGDAAVKAEGSATIINGAADELAQGVSRLQRQAQEKRARQPEFCLTPSCGDVVMRSPSRWRQNSSRVFSGSSHSL